MDTILKGLLLSNQPNTVKKQFIQKLSEISPENINELTHHKVFDICLHFLYPIPNKIVPETLSSVNFSFQITHDDKLKQALLNLLRLWIEKHNEKYFNLYMQKSFLAVNFHQLDASGAIQYLISLHQFLTVFKELFDLKSLNCKLQVKEYLLNSFVKINNFHVLICFCKLYLHNSVFIPIQVDHDKKIEFVKCFIVTVSKHPFQFLAQSQNNIDGDQNSTITNEDMLKLQQNTLYKDLDIIFELFSKYVSYDMSLMKCIAGIIFKTMSSSSDPPSINIARFLPCLRLDIINESLEEIMTLKNFNEILFNCLLNLVDLNCYPVSSIGVNEWVIQFMKCLIKYKKFTILFNVIELKIKQICNLIFIRCTRKSSVSILTFMLISYLHSPLPFHQICPVLSSLVISLKNVKDEETQQILQVLVELTYTLMYHFPGYPDIYGKLMDCLQGYMKPSEENMKTWLQASFSLPQANTPTSILRKKSETGKIGLENLGNTCYANSVIQALFSSKSFRDEVMLKPFFPNLHPISSSLQQLFALLYLSERPAIAPSDFLTMSRPQWFQKGTQQDCSEYLKFLFDMIEQEERKNCNPSFINHFNGSMRTSIECLSCHSVSCREEIFNDIPLSFNDDELNRCTLKGGNSSEQIQRKMSLTTDSSINKDSPVLSETSDGATSANEELLLIALNSKPKSIVDLLNSYFQPESLLESNQYFCSKCDFLQDAMKLHEVSVYPKYLVLTLKRFTYDSVTHQRNKLLQVLNYPVEFFMCGYCGRSQNPTSNTLVTNESCSCENVVRYQISSVIVHSGISSESGHYYSYVCESQDGNERNWYLMNDSRVSQTQSNCLSKLGETFPRDSPYICIYEQINIEPVSDNHTGSHVIVKEHRCEVKLSQMLMDFVSKDNEQFFKEESHKQTPKIQNFNFNRNYDNDHDDPGNNGGQHSSVNNNWSGGGRFIF